LPAAALTHGFKAGFVVAGGFCMVGALVAMVFLPRQRRRAEDAHAETAALSFARSPGAPSCGHLARASLEPETAARDAH